MSRIFCILVIALLVAATQAEVEGVRYGAFWRPLTARERALRKRAQVRQGKFHTQAETAPEPPATHEFPEGATTLPANVTQHEEATTLPANVTHHEEATTLPANVTQHEEATTLPANVTTPVDERKEHNMEEGKHKEGEEKEGEKKEGEHHHKEGEEGENPQCTEEAKEEEAKELAEEAKVRWTIVLGMFCMFLMFMCGYALEANHIEFVPEAGAGIAIGAVASFLISLAGSDVNLIQFDPEFFFIFLLPPIIFEAGYNMKRQAFFRNIGSICLYAFIGTTVSTFLVGGSVYYAGQWGLCHPLGGLASLVFGALISATDPVTVLAVFQKLHANVDLYSLVFGESVLNDAVAIVLYRALVEFKCGFSGEGVVAAIVSFFVIFIGSVLIGVAVAVFSAISLKYTRMRADKDFFFLEICTLCTFPYLAFMIAEGLHLSGIVSILFAGIGMAHYTYNNLSPEAADMSRKLFKIVAQLAESFVFVYLGFAMFSFPQTWKLIALVAVAFMACLVARVLNVVPNSLLANLGRKEDRQITAKMQFTMWFSGLRGAVAFVIAVTSWAHQDFPQINDPADPDFTDSDCILTITLLIAIITIFTMGGPISYVITWFNLREEATAEEGAAYGGTTVGLMGRGASAPMPATGLIKYDRKYIKPLLTTYSFVQEPLQDVNLTAIHHTSDGEHDGDAPVQL